MLILNNARKLADNYTIDFEMTQPMEPFLEHKRAKNDDKIQEVALTQAQPKNLNKRSTQVLAKVVCNLESLQQPIQ